MKATTMNKTTGSFFTGGGLFDIGAIAAGYTPIWGLEKDDKIAKVARLNGLPVHTADVITFDITQLERPDHFHASPPCPNFSVAKQGAEETELDLAMADAVCRALVHWKPDSFTLENVIGYRNSQSFANVMKTLETLGYWYDATNLNAADFGVPQTRNRLFIRATRGLLRGYPPPVQWRGWYEAIEGLIPGLPDAEFAPWQIARLPEAYKKGMDMSGNFFIGGGNKSKSFLDFAIENRPSIPGIRNGSEPMLTVPADPATNGAGRAFIVQPQGMNSKGYRNADEPMQTLSTSHTAGKYKAFILDGQGNESERVTVRDGDEPIFTMTASNNKRPARAYVPGRVVKMTVQCLGRFQTVPDTYKGLTVKINGNGVPCLMAQRVLETL
jgi:DNA (cytosine-5)-methyltransferase 1